MATARQIGWLALAVVLACGLLWLVRASSTRTVGSGAPVEVEPARSETAFLDRYSGTSSWSLLEPAAPGAWRRLVRADGLEVVLPSKPERLVSQSLASDEILLEMVEPSRVVGITRMATDPRYSNVVSLAEPMEAARVLNSSEQILGLRPDLVFVTSFSTLETVQQLRSAGAPVLQLGGYESLSGIEDNVRVIGFATGEDRRAEEMIRALQRRIAAAVDSLPQDRRRWRVLSYTDGTVWARRTTFDDVMTLVGAINIPGEAGLTGWPRVSLEQILAWQPEVLIAGGLEGEEDRVRSELLALPGMAETPAGRNQRILIIPSRLFSTVSHHIAGFIELAAAGLASLEEAPPVAGEAAAEVRATP